MLWKCSKGHEWYARIVDRTLDKTKCPYCLEDIRAEINSKSQLKVGENDLDTWCKQNGQWGEKLNLEWTGICDDGKTYNINEVTKSSPRKMLWKCTKGHEWFSTIGNRTTLRNGCPYCNTKGTSYPEQFLYRALKQIYPQTISRGKFQDIEYDITIPEERTCIEYSGTYWHLDKLERDRMKADICEQYNMRFIQIYANYDSTNKEELYDKNLIIYTANTNKYILDKQLVNILNHILESFNHSIKEIDIEKAQTEAFNFMHDI